MFPYDLALLIIAGPTSVFKPYAKEGHEPQGRLHQGRPVLATGRHRSPPGLDDFFKAFNLVIGRGLVIHPGRHHPDAELSSASEGQPGAPRYRRLASRPGRSVRRMPIHILQGPSAPGKPGTAGQLTWSPSPSSTPDQQYVTMRQAYCYPSCDSAAQILEQTGSRLRPGSGSAADGL